MPPSIRIMLTKKRDEGLCCVCEAVVPEGEVHATAVRTFGRSNAGKVKYQTEHLHVACVPALLIADHVRYATRTKRVGRRAASIPEEFLVERRRLIRTRARILRQVIRMDDPEEIACARERIVRINIGLTERGGMPRERMMRRSKEDRAILEAKLNV